MAVTKKKAHDLKDKRDIYRLLAMIDLITMISVYRISIYLSLGMFILLLYLLNREKIYSIGYKGEKKVTKEITRKFNNNYILLNELTFNNEKTEETAQIDHILIGECAVFCLETKNYRGYIAGSQFDHEWEKSNIGKQTGMIQKNGNKIKTTTFYNPLKQNHTHKKVLEKIINDKSVPIINMVVFADNNVILNITMEDKKYTAVVQLSNLEQTIRYYDSIFHYPTILSDEKKNEIIRKIKENEIK